MAGAIRSEGYTGLGSVVSSSPLSLHSHRQSYEEPPRTQLFEPSSLSPTHTRIVPPHAPQPHRNSTTMHPNLQRTTVSHDAIDAAYTRDLDELASASPIVTSQLANTIEAVIDSPSHATSGAPSRGCRHPCPARPCSDVSLLWVRPRLSQAHEARLRMAAQTSWYYETNSSDDDGLLLISRGTR